jgi:hypothetical protein
MLVSHEQMISHQRPLLGTLTWPPCLCHFIPLGMSENQEFVFEPLRRVTPLMKLFSQHR